MDDLDKLRTFAANLRAAEGRAEGMRTARDELAVKLAREARRSTARRDGAQKEIAEAAGVSTAYIRGLLGPRKGK